MSTSTVTLPSSPSAGHERFSGLLDGLIDAAVIIDRDLTPVAWNVAYTQTVGLRAKRFANRVAERGTRCCDLFELEVCERGCLAKRCFEKGRSVRVDEIMGGSRIALAERGLPDPLVPRNYTLIVSAVPIQDDDGKIIAVMEVYRDVTAEARIQERYKYLLDQERRRAVILEDLVKARTAELEKSLADLQRTRAQLVQSEKLSSLGQLVAGIAHEINNPINFIYGNTDFLRQYVGNFQELIADLDKVAMSPEDRKKIDDLKGRLDYDYLVEDTGKLLNSIRNGAERATAIIRDLRAFIHGGSTERAPVSLVKCVDTTLNLVTHETRGRIELVRRYTDDVPMILGNEGQLNQVFMNLVVNAIQAIKEKGTITVSIEEREDGIAIDVNDTGCGISEPEQLKVFDPFFTTKPVGQGTGLGLSISYSIVDGHGGRLSLASQLEDGTTFTVWLPRSIVLDKTARAP